MKKVIFTVLIIFMMTGLVFAQGLPGIGDNPIFAILGFGTAFESPQNKATQGLFRSDADIFIRPDKFSEVDFDSFYSMISFASSISAQLGFATEISNLYFAGAYGGTFWANKTPFNYNEQRAEGWPGGAKIVPHYSSLNFTPNEPMNQYSLLVGLEDFGFRFTYSSTRESFSDKEFVSGGSNYKNYKSALGTVSPQIAFAFTKDMNENGIKPWVTLDLDFYKDYAKSERYTGEETKTSGTEIVRSNNSFSPTFSLGLGGYTFLSDDNFKVSADVEYILSLTSYNNEYHYTNSENIFVTKKIKGIGFTQQSDSLNIFNPSVTGEWNFDRLSLGLKLSLPVIFMGGKSTEMAYKTDTTTGELIKEGDDRKTSGIGFIPDLRLAAQINLLSNLSLNAGGRIATSPLIRTVSKGDSYTQGNKTENTSYKRVNKEYGNNIINELTAGLSFKPLSSVTFEANSTIATSNNVINVFGFESSEGGLFRFTNFLISIKF